MTQISRARQMTGIMGARQITGITRNKPRLKNLVRNKGINK